MDNFGLTSAQILAKGAAGKPASVQKRITARVVALSSNRAGRLTVRLDNDQVWTQTEDDADAKLAIGGEVTIDRGMLGAYFLSGQSKRAAIKVKRVQ